MSPEIPPDIRARLAKIVFVYLPILFSANLCAQTCEVVNVSPLNTEFGISGGSGTATVQVSGSGCSWIASLVEPESSWITLQGTTSGTVANGAQVSVSYTIPANTGAPRAGALNITVTGGASVVFGFGEASPLIPPLIFSCTNPNGPATEGASYSNTCTISGGTPPYVANLVAGGIPAGLSIVYTSDSVAISGAPTVTGPYSYTLLATDSTSVQDEFVSLVYSGTIAPAGSNCSLSTGSQATNQTFNSGGGSGSFYFTPGASGCSWSASAGASWVTLNPPVSGTTMAGTATTVSFSVSPNTGSASRNTVVTITAPGGATASFGIQEAAPSTALTMQCSGAAGPSQVGVAYLNTCTGSGGTPPYTVQITGGALPAGITTVPVANGVTVSGTPTQAGPYGYTVSMNDSGASQQAASQAFSGTIAAAACTLSTGNQALTETFSAAGGAGSASATPSSSGCSWTAATTGAPWITFTGTTSGTTAAGVAISVPFAVSANSTSSNRGASVTISLTGGAIATYTIQQSQSGVSGVSLQCSTTAGPAQIGVVYSATCTASGGVPPYSFVISNNPPPGLQSVATAASITISGTPTAAESYRYIVSASDSERVPQSASQTFTGTVAAGVVAMNCSTALGPAQVGVPYSETCSASGGLPPYSFVVSNNPLPPGLQSSTTANSITITGTPTVAEDYRYIVSAIDSESIPQNASEIFQGTVAPAAAPLSFRCSSAAGPAQVGVAYLATCTASGGVTPYFFAIASGAVPAGIQTASNSTTVTISGSPTAAGVYRYAVSVTDSEATAQTASQTFSGTIVAAVVPLSFLCGSSVGPAETGVSYSVTCIASGGVAPYTFAITNGALPAGIQPFSNSSTVTITGTPTAAGPYNYVVGVTDSEQPAHTAAQTFTGTISPAAGQCKPGEANGVPGYGYSFTPYDVTASTSLTLTFDAPGCSWSVFSNAPWLTATSAASGNISEGDTLEQVSIGYLVQANTTALPRFAQLSVVVNGVVAVSIPVPQNASTCTFAVTPQTVNISAAGGPLNLGFSSSPPGCTAYASGNAWTGLPNVIGNSAAFFIPPNEGGARSETILFGALQGIASGPQAMLTITQDAGTTALVTTCAQSGELAMSQQLDVFCEAGGGVPPYHWSVNGVVPPNTSLIPNGATWTLTTSAPGAGAYNFTVTVTDSGVPAPSSATSQTFQGTVSATPLQVQCSGSSAFEEGIPYLQTCTTLDATPPVHWTITPGPLPGGISLTANSDGSATLSGTPTVSGPFEFALQATDSSAPTPATQSYRFNGVIPSSPSLNCTPIAGPVLFGASYSASCIAAGGTAPYHWSIAQGALPAGLSLVVASSTSTAMISGSPGSTGAYDYTIGIADSSLPTALTASQTYSGTIVLPGLPLLTVSPPSLSLTPASPAPSAVTGTLSVFCSGGAISFTATASSSGWLSVQHDGVTPGSIVVSVSTQSLVPGTLYSGRVVISAPGANPSSFTVPVSVMIPQAPALSISPSSFLVPTTAGAEPIGGQITVFNTGGGALNFAVSQTGGNWLLPGVSTGTATPGEPAAIPFVIVPTGLTPGTYAAQILVSASGSQMAAVVVTLSVSPGQGSISVSPNWMSFTATAGGAAPEPQGLSVLNLGQGTLHWSAAASTLSGGTWLGANPASGVATAGGQAGSLSVSVNPSQLNPGTYYGSVEVAAPEAPTSQTLTVALNVLDPNQTQAPQVDPSGLLLTASAPSGTITLTNFGSRALSFSALATTQTGGNWLSVTPSSGTAAPGSLNLSVNANTGMGAGVYQGELSIAFGDGTVRNLSVALVLPGHGSAQAALREVASTAPASACVPSQLVPLFTSIGPEFTLTASQPVNLQAVVVDDCAKPVSSGSVVFRISTSDPGISLSPVGGGVWQGIWTPVTADAAATLTLAALEGSLSGQAQLQGAVSASPAGGAPQITAVLNSASYANAGQAPSGTWVSIFGENLADRPESASGSFPAVLNGTQVLIGSTPLPLQFAGPNQINALVPASVPANSIQSLVVQRDGAASAPALVAVAEYLPALYSVNQVGSGQGAILIANTSSLAAPTGAYPGSRPVHSGEYLEIYAGGLGPTSNPPADGAPAPGPPNLAATILQPAVTIGGVPAATVSYSGLAPGLAGLYQIDVQVPGSVAPGSAIPVVVTMNGTDSNTVTIAVE